MKKLMNRILEAGLIIAMAMPPLPAIAGESLTNSGRAPPVIRKRQLQATLH